MAILRRKLNQSFSVGYSNSEQDDNATDSIALELVDGTSCDDIEFLLYNKKRLSVYLNSTEGSYNRLGTVYTDIDEVVNMTGSKTTGVGTPGVTQVTAMDVIGNVLRVRDDDLQVGALGNFVFDMDSEEIVYNGEDDVFAVIRIQYTSQGIRYKFNWPNNEDIVDAMVVAVASDGCKASLQISRADCKGDDETKDVDDTSSENTNLEFPLNMNASWTVMKSMGVGSHSIYCMLYMYPVHTGLPPDIKVAFGKVSTLVDCLFTEDTSLAQFKQLSEAVNFSSSSISNLQCFVGSFSNLSIAAESDFFDAKGNQVLIPTFKGPGDSVMVEEWRDVQVTVKDASGQDKEISVRRQIQYSKRLGPTEVAVVTSSGILQAVTGVARVLYQVPQKAGILKIDVNMTDADYKDWQCQAYGSYQYTDVFYSHQTLVFNGQLTIPTPMNSSPALDAREQSIKTRIST